MSTPPPSETPVADGLSDPLLVPHTGFVGGRISPPPSKSYSHRALNLAWLGARRLEVRSLLDAEDTTLFRGALRAAGWGVEENPLHDRGAVDVVLDPCSTANAETTKIFCGNAGTMFRFLTATLCVAPGRFVLDGTPRLRERPIGPLVDALRQLGAEISYLEGDGVAPLRIEGGSLQGGSCTLQAGSSSQYLSALMMAGSFAPTPLEIELASLTSQSYVEVTLDAMKQFGIDSVTPTASGYRVEPLSSELLAREFVVETDDSAAAYPAAAAMITGQAVALIGLRRESIQGDRRFLDVLAEMGAELRWRGDELEITGRVRRAVDVDMGSMPDQVPTLAAVAAFAPGQTTVRGAAHLRIKESDRLEAMTTELRKLGVLIKERHDGLVIEGDARRLAEWPAPDDVFIDPRADHRIAMSLALVGMKRPRVWINDPTTVDKSYPQFWLHHFALA